MFSDGCCRDRPPQPCSQPFCLCFKALPARLGGPPIFAGVKAQGRPNFFCPLSIVDRSACLKTNQRLTGLSEHDRPVCRSVFAWTGLESLPGMCILWLKTA